MSGHSRWTDLQRAVPIDPGIIERTRIWVRGYILALEDVIRDLEVQAEGYATSNIIFRINPFDALGAAKEKVQESLTSARVTLDALDRGAGDGQELPSPAREAQEP